MLSKTEYNHYLRNRSLFQRLRDWILARYGYINVHTLDFARDVSKRLDEHREVMEAIKTHTTLFETHWWHFWHMKTTDDYLQILYELRHGVSWSAHVSKYRSSVREPITK